MAKSKAAKAVFKDELGEKFSKVSASIVAEYRGLTADDITLLRRELRKVGSEFKVVKNRLAKIAIDERASDMVELKPRLVGPVGITYVYQDVAAGAKVLIDFGKDRENFKVTGGILDGKPLSKADIKALSELPSREVLLARMLGSLTSPHRGIMTVVNGVASKLVRVVSAIKDTKA